MTCPNVPAAIGFLVGRKVATLHELETVYGCQDTYDLLEITRVDEYNAHSNR